MTLDSVIMRVADYNASPDLKKFAESLFGLPDDAIKVPSHLKDEIYRKCKEYASVFATTGNPEEASKFIDAAMSLK